MKKCNKCLVNKSFADFVSDKRSKDNIGYYCKDCINKYNYSRYHSNTEYKRKIKMNNLKWASKNKPSLKNYQQLYAFKLKINVISHYSNNKNCCSCCGEKHIEFLCIDHINGGGNIHRKSINRSGFMFYKWLINNKYPDGYSVLCHNCNQAKGNFGNCPHKGKTIYSKFIIS